MMLYYVKIGVYYEDIEPQAIYPDKAWRSQVVCPQCFCIDRRCHPAPVDIILEDVPGEDQTSVLVTTTNITIWRKEFIEKLCRYEKGFAVGRCFTSGGNIIKEYVTCYLKSSITIRGNRQSRYQLCPNCSVILSHVEPGPKYVLSRQLSKAKIYQDALCRFYVTEDVVDDFEELPEDLAFDAISVRNTPVDGQFLPYDESDKTNSI